MHSLGILLLLSDPTLTVGLVPPRHVVRALVPPRQDYRQDYLPGATGT
jgi:hypothetical protein